MHRHDADDQLAQIPIFSGIDAKERAKIRNMMTGMNVDTGRVLVKQAPTGTSSS